MCNHGSFSATEGDINVSLHNFLDLSLIDLYKEIVAVTGFSNGYCRLLHVREKNSIAATVVATRPATVASCLFLWQPVAAAILVRHGNAVDFDVSDRRGNSCSSGFGRYKTATIISPPTGSRLHPCIPSIN